MTAASHPRYATPMNILLNGDKRDVPAGYTATQLVTELNLLGKRIAMEVNEDILPRGEFDSYVFQENDNIEIVHAVGGG